MTPREITIEYVHGTGRELRWRIDDARVERLWLPLVGPTPFCILRMLHDDCVDLFKPRDYTVAEIAARVGTKSVRAWQSILRLNRFALLFAGDDRDDRDEDRPIFQLPYDVRPLSEREWKKLPAVVRDQYDTMPL